MSFISIVVQVAIDMMKRELWRGQNVFVIFQVCDSGYSQPAEAENLERGMQTEVREAATAAVFPSESVCLTDGRHLGFAFKTWRAKC